MSARRLLTALVMGALAALILMSLFAAPAAGLILLNIAWTPLILAALTAGLTGGLVAGATAMGVGYVAGGVLVAVLILVSMALPALFVAWLALGRRTMPDGTVVWRDASSAAVWLAWGGVAIIGAAGLMTLGTPDGLRGFLRLAFTVNAETAWRMMPMGTGSMSEVVELMLWFAPGMAIAFLTVGLVMNAALAQGLAMRFGTNLRPPMRLAELDLPAWMALALGIALFAAVASPSIVGWYGWHVAMVLAGVYLLAGLSVVHAATRGRAGRGLTLGLLYATLVLFWPAAILVIVLGVIETWARLKRRFGSPGRTLED
jgi:uncharacterized protein YybS (DUF2232 family)